MAEFLILLLIAVVANASLGAIGAAANRVKTSDERLLWVIGGAIGGVLAVFGWLGMVVGVFALFGRSVSVVGAATVGLIVVATAGLLGVVISPVLDDTDSVPVWLFSFLIKWVQSPLLTTVGLVAALTVAIGRDTVDFRRGMLFIKVGPGGGALTLGAVAWTQSGRFNPDRLVPDNLARHEATHSRTVAAICAHRWRRRSGAVKLLAASPGWIHHHCVDGQDAEAGALVDDLVEALSGVSHRTRRRTARPVSPKPTPASTSTVPTTMTLTWGPCEPRPAR